jgi:hypothetical protein
MGKRDDDIQLSLFGTEPRILHRREGPRTSVAAAYIVKTGKLEKQMYDAICEFGPRGCIADDLIKLFPKLPYSSITARPSALERKGLITRGPDERIGEAGAGQLVMRKSRIADILLHGEATFEEG